MVHSMHEDITIEIARTLRECRELVLRRIAEKQLGQAWVDLPVNTEAGEPNAREKAGRDYPRWNEGFPG